MVRSTPACKKWFYVLILCVVGCLNYLDRTMITTMRTSIIDSIPMTDAKFALLTSSFLWVYGFLSPVGGYLADRFSRSKVIIVSLFVWSLVTWLTSHVTSFEQLLATRILMGISEACYIPAALALITDYHDDRTRSLAVGLHMVGVNVGQALGFLGGWTAETHSWNYAFHFFGLVGIIYAVFLLFVLKDPAPGRINTGTGISQTKPLAFSAVVASLFKSRAYILALCFWGFLGVVGWIVIGWLPTYLKETFLLSQSRAGLYATAYLFSISIAGLLVGGFLADKLSVKYRNARIWVPAIGLLVAAPAIFIAGTTNVLSIALAGFMAYAFTRAFTDANMMPILYLIADKKFLATGYGILNLFACIVGGAGIYLGGVLRDSNINLSGLYQLAAVILLICSILLTCIGVAKQKTMS